MKNLDPMTRISEHFILADFLGCQSVYSKGYANGLHADAQANFRMGNGRTLCTELLEPLLDIYGPISISYGYISPELSQQIVRYQDPNKPSHHRWDLGAAADVCVHNWYGNGEFTDDEHSPIALAHDIDGYGFPYSRMITYSESPYICLAASTLEVERQAPRGSFYENRYTGKPKVKPDYRQYMSDAIKRRASRDLHDNGLAHGWFGAGYPTYHGGGFRQYQHMRVSKYTMVSDWLLDLQSIAQGAKNIPSLNDDRVQDAFAAAGILYDNMLEMSGCNRLSIVAGYVSHLNPFFDSTRDWRGPDVHFSVVPPESVTPEFLIAQCRDGSSAVDMWREGDRVCVCADIDYLLTS